MKATLHPASYFSLVSEQLVRCELCPRRCVISSGESGFCQVRFNRDGKLYSSVYGFPAAVQIDPIEKKPISYWKSGTKTFSLGTFGCNFTCLYCQNDSLSRVSSDPLRKTKYVEPEEIVRLAKRYSCESIAFTYNEPTVFFEYALEIAKLAKAAGLATVLVSNGWINPEPRAELYQYIDAANIDLKAFSEDFYSKLCGGSLAEVLKSCKHLRFVSKSHLEITNLVIPGYNDKKEQVTELLQWVADELGTDTPLHFSAYFPAAGFTALATKASTLYEIREMASNLGFNKVKLGNLR